MWCFRWMFVLTFVFTPTAGAESPPIILDQAGLFSPRAVNRVTEIGEKLRQQNKMDLCIETRPQAPGMAPDLIRRMRNRLFENQRIEAAKKRAEELGVHGLYVMITTEPQHVTVVGWPSPDEQEAKRYRDAHFSTAAPRETSWYKRRELQRALAKISDKNSADDVLIKAIDQYWSRVQAPPQESPLETIPALIVAGGLVGFWVVLRVIRSRLPDRRPIYQPAMLGSILGVPAGFWINDRLFQSERPVSPSYASLPPSHAEERDPISDSGSERAGDQL